MSVQYRYSMPFLPDMFRIEHCLAWKNSLNCLSIIYISISLYKYRLTSHRSLCLCEYHATFVDLLQTNQSICLMNRQYFLGNSLSAGITNIFAKTNRQIWTYLYSFHKKDKIVMSWNWKWNSSSLVDS